MTRKKKKKQIREWKVERKRKEQERTYKVEKR